MALGSEGTQGEWCAADSYAEHKKHTSRQPSAESQASALPTLPGAPRPPAAYFTRVPPWAAKGPLPPPPLTHGCRHLCEAGTRPLRCRNVDQLKSGVPASLRHGAGEHTAGRKFSGPGEAVSVRGCAFGSAPGCPLPVEHNPLQHSRTPQPCTAAAPHAHGGGPGRAPGASALAAARGRLQRRGAGWCTLAAPPPGSTPPRLRSWA